MTTVLELLELFDKAEWIAVIAAAAACAAAVFARQSSASAKKSYRLQEKAYADKQPRLVAYPLDAKKLRSKNLKSQYVFRVLISNPSDNDNSVARAELRIDYRRETRASNFILPAITGQSRDSAEDREVLRPPFQVTAHSAMQGSFVFELAEEYFDGIEVQGYRIILHDPQGTTTEIAQNIVDGAGLVWGQKE